MNILNEQERILFELFVQESLELSEQANNTLGMLENRFDDELFNEFFRIIHSIKGTSVSMGYERLSHFLHIVESIIVKIGKKEIQWGDSIIGLLYDCIYKIKLTVNKISTNIISDLEECELSNKINKYVDAKTLSQGVIRSDKFYITEYEMLIMDDAVKKGENVFVIKIDINKESIMKSMKSLLIINNFNRSGQVLRVHPNNCDRIEDANFPTSIKIILLTVDTKEIVIKNIEVASDIDNIIIEKFMGKDFYDESNTSLFEVKVRKSLKDNDLFRRKERSTIRVDISQLDEFYQKFNKLVRDKSLLSGVISNIDDKYSNDNDVKEGILLLKSIDGVSNELEELFIDIRVYTIRNIISRLEQLVSNLSARSQKKVQFFSEGNGIKIDRRILELIVDPLVHIMRNSVDHGIENISGRIDKGKSEYASISLKIIHKKDYIFFEVSDDGKGIDIEDVKHEMINKGLISRQEIKNMSEQEILGYIFEPGFSTSKVISDISGRGVGMDVVKTNVEKLNGFINILTEKDKGTKITLMIPLTLITIPSLIFIENDYLLAINDYLVGDVFALSKEQIESRIYFEDEKDWFLYGNCKLPLVNLNEYFETVDKDNKNYTAIVFKENDRRVCLIVDEVISRRNLIVKYDSNQFDDFNVKFGNDILGLSYSKNGDVIYLLDIEKIMCQKNL